MSGEWDQEMLLETFDVNELIELGMESEIDFNHDIGKEELDEKNEVLRPLRWTRILLSIPVGVTIKNIDDVMSEIEKNGGLVDYASN